MRQAGRSREPDTPLRWDREALGPRKPAAAKFFADFPEFPGLPSADGTQLSSTGLPPRSLGLVPPSPDLAARGRGRGVGTGREGSGFLAHGAMLLSESLSGERCCPLADWYLSGRNAERWECLGREAGGPCRERGELPFRPSAAFHAWALS